MAADSLGGELMADEMDTPSAEGIGARATVVSCWICGVHLHASQVMPVSTAGEFHTAGAREGDTGAPKHPNAGTGPFV